MQLGHHQAMGEVAAVVDKEKPVAFANESLRKAQERSRHFVQGMAQERIGEENKKLIRSMQEIVHRPGQVVRMIHDSENTGHGPWMAAHCNDFYRNRTRQQRRLQEENQALVKRLMAAHSTVNSRAHERDYQQHRTRADRMKKVSGWQQASTQHGKSRTPSRLAASASAPAMPSGYPPPAPRAHARRAAASPLPPLAEQPPGPARTRSQPPQQPPQHLPRAAVHQLQAGALAPDAPADASPGGRSPGRRSSGGRSPRRVRRGMAELPPVMELITGMAEPRDGPRWERRRSSKAWSPSRGSVGRLPAMAAVSSGSNSWRSWRKPSKAHREASGEEHAATGPRMPPDSVAAGAGNAMGARRSGGGRKSLSSSRRTLGESSGDEGAAAGPRRGLKGSAWGERALRAPSVACFSFLGMWISRWSKSKPQGVLREGPHPLGVLLWGSAQAHSRRQTQRSHPLPLETLPQQPLPRT
ncbi:unnamed protein product [Prorocentrum cordatum]|uniref:Uncharacterized protein n=1 Tax=Prorocentrum cordatum TaxID=2364126 RepID=A0ABN9SWV4_9DINO|nr:unnamed protein product [Polarella glacialis]